MQRAVENGFGLSRNVLLISLAYFALGFGTSVWLFLFPNYLAGLGLTALWVGAIYTSYNAFLSLTALPSGRLSDLIGRRTPLVVGSGMITAVTLLLLFTFNPYFILLLLIAFGFGQGLMNPAASALVAESVSQQRSGSAYAVFQIFWIVGSAVGAGISGYLPDSWKFPSGAVFLSLTFLLVRGVGEANGQTVNAEYREALRESLQTSVSGSIRLLREDRDLFLLAVGLAVHSFGFAMLLPYLSLYAQFGASSRLFEVGIIGGIWYLSLVAGQLPFGRLTDRIGGELVLFLHLVFSTFTWALYGLTQSFTAAAGAMILFGLVGSMDIPARRTIMVEHALGGVGKGTVIGTLDALTGVAGIAAPFFGGLAWSALGYSAPFLIASVVNTVGLIPLYFLVQRRRTRARTTHILPEKPRAP